VVSRTCETIMTPATIILDPWVSDSAPSVSSRCGIGRCDESIPGSGCSGRKIQSAGAFPPLGDRSNSSGFGRWPFFQLAIDLAALGACALLTCATAAAIGASVFILFFVRT
jgi:hypothetical protein